MEINLPAGKYVVAVSGGVDSMALLHMLKDMPGLSLTVAHFDHGIRQDSVEDRRLVQDLAKEYRLPFVFHEGNLGPNASEASARIARYEFLHQVRRTSGASAIITAHHQDDLLETIILNLLRGTGRRGLSSLKSTDVLKRPLLSVPKEELLRYAKREGLKWREDSTNIDQKYLRNYVRMNILPHFAKADREALLELSRSTANINQQIHNQATNYLHLQPSPKRLDRSSFTNLPHAVSREIMAEWLLANTATVLSRQLLERLVVAAKTLEPHKQIDVDREYRLVLSPTTIALLPR
ncbi:MAG: tRNA lysidine(34) synthetase TilS [Candidatus Saccharimonadales bacterium]